MSGAAVAPLAGPTGSAGPVAAIAAVRRQRRRSAVVVVLLAAAAAVVAVVALGIGPVALSPGTVLAVLAAHAPVPSPWPAPAPLAEQVVWGTRAPRVAMAVVAGAGLAVAGAVLQAVARNGLADPYLLGLNAGASTGVAFVVLVVGAAGGLVLAGAALAGAVGAIALVSLLAAGAAVRGPARFVLAGLAVGYALSAVTSFLLFWSDSPEASRSVLFWLLGSLAGTRPESLAAATAACVLGTAALVAGGWRLDALVSGDDSALAAGIDPERTRFAVLIGTSALVGVLVAGVGGVGFVGLVVPHAARALVGGSHRRVLLASAALGAALLVVADTVARTAFAPQEIPVGVVTGVVGAPALLLLLRHDPGRSPAS